MSEWLRGFRDGLRGYTAFFLVTDDASAVNRYDEGWMSGHRVRCWLVP